MYFPLIHCPNTKYKKIKFGFSGGIPNFNYRSQVLIIWNCGEMKLDANVRIAWESDFAKCAEFCKKIQNEKSEFFLSFLSSQVLHIEFSQDWHTNIHARLKQLWMRLILSFQWFLQAHSVSNNLWHMTLNSSAGCLSFYLGLRTRKMDK